MNLLSKSTLLMLFVSLTAFTSDNTLLEDKLNRAQMTFTMPKGFVTIPVIDNKKFKYDYAIKHIDKDFEIRITVRPLDEMFKKHQELTSKGSVMVSPNKLYPGAFYAIVKNISGANIGKPGNLPEAGVKKEFNADWGAVNLLEPNEEFGQGYKHAMILALHKDNLADAYCVFLFNNKETLGELMPSVYYSMKFK